MRNLEALAFRRLNGVVEYLDQTKLPHQEVWIKASTIEDMFVAIKELRVRGAPLIGVAAATSLAQFVASGASQVEVLKAAEYLKSARPTAVNLNAAVDRCLKNISKIPEEAENIFFEDEELCERIGKFGFELIENGSNVMTICNAGALATAGIGTALGIFRYAWRKGKRFHVYVNETRPLLQGGRLTAWELAKEGIPFTLMCDNMAASVFGTKKFSSVFVGADRIAKNGDFANKIGTCGLAIIAKHYNVPFYTAAPYTTVDLKTLTGKDIPIEHRDPSEVIGSTSVKGCNVYNPAFDVTPAELTSGWILDSGLFNKPNFTAV